MSVEKKYTRKPLNFHATYTLADTAANATDLYIDVRGVTDLTIFVKNTHGSAQITISIDWHMSQEEAVANWIDALGSDPTIASGAIDHWRFSSRFPLYTTDLLVDPYFSDVLPCNFIKLRMFGTTAASSCEVWIQGHKRRL